MFEKKDNRTFKYSGFLKQFFAWPVYIGIILVIVNVIVLFIDMVAASIIGAFMIIYLIACGFMYFYLRPGIMNSMVDFASNYSQVQRQLMYNLSVPYCLLDGIGNVLWMNKAMMEAINKNKDFKSNIGIIILDVKSSIFPEDINISTEIRTHLAERDYKIEIKKLETANIIEGVDIINQDSDSDFYAMYMYDETDINSYIQKLKDERFVVGLVYVDNFEEAMESLDDVKKSLFVGLLDKKINKCFAPGAAIVRKLEKDKYLVVFKYKFLEKLQAEKFSVLEDVKSKKLANDMMVTLSIGVGTGTSDYAKNFEVAKSAMDLAQGRGGDQAVVKDGEKISYYGGKSQQMEKNTRVKVRMKAHALKQFIEDNDKLLVMGHSTADIDAFGSALGIYLIARKLGKEAHIVLGEVTGSIRPFVNKFIESPEYPNDMFVKPEDAPTHLTASTVVVVVDVNRPQRTECPELLDKCKTLILFDHHRISTDTITGVVLSHVDPYASSACEMVTEMIQYIEDGFKLKAVEADALYAGINIDTDGFNSKSGPRTFEAAAFLRRNGADVTRVRKMLRTGMSEYKAVAQAVSRAEVYKNAFAISVYNGVGIDNPTIGGAKAANQLLDISGIKASFVITEYGDKIYISARSIDEVNVQLVMEKLGGGGHMSIAGAQLVGSTVDNAILTVKNTLDDMIKEGEI